MVRTGTDRDFGQLDLQLPDPYSDSITRYWKREIIQGGLRKFPEPISQ
jgi:hypothetical protein